MLVQGIVPDMERRLAFLSEKVASTRKGFKNQVNSAFNNHYKDKVDKK
jgi:hypothetical protein